MLCFCSAVKMLQFVAFERVVEKYYFLVEKNNKKNWLIWNEGESNIYPARKKNTLL